MDVYDDRMLPCGEVESLKAAVEETAAAAEDTAASAEDEGS